jgi:hypothetical protein
LFLDKFLQARLVPASSSPPSRQGHFVSWAPSHQNWFNINFDLAVKIIARLVLGSLSMMIRVNLWLLSVLWIVGV